MPKSITCSYCNLEPYIQIIRITNPRSAQLERSVAPNQCVLFNAPEDALLEVHGGNLMTVIHEDTVPCSQLKVATNIDNLVRDNFVRKESKTSIFSLAA